jgi:putative endonuclease
VFVYIIECKNGKYYTGMAYDLERRINQHKEGRGARFIKTFGFKELVYVERRRTRSLAMRREREIKRMSRIEKEVLIKNGKNIERTV